MTSEGKFTSRPCSPPGRCRIPQRPCTEIAAFTAELDRAGIDQPDHSPLVEIDDGHHPLDRARPEIARTGTVVASDPDEAAANFTRVADITGRKGDANDAIECVKAAVAHRFPPPGVFHRYPSGRRPLLGRNGTLYARYRRPAFDAADGKLDHRFIDATVPAQDDEGPPRDGLPWLRSQHRRLVRFVEVDRRKARAVIG